MDELQWVDPVSVLATNDEALIAVAQSVLGGAGIRCTVENYYLNSLRPAGASLDAFRSPMKLLVDPENADRARELLRPIVHEEPETDLPKSTRRWLIFFILILPLSLMLWEVVREFVVYYRK